MAELADLRRYSIPVLDPRHLRTLDAATLGILLREIIVRCRTLTARGNEHLLAGDLTPFEPACWVAAPELVPEIMSCSAAILARGLAGQDEALAREMLREYARHAVDLRYRMACIRNELQLANRP